MSIRQYDFVTGIESASAPGAGTPTLSGDFTTLGYQQSHFVQGAQPVADITALKAIGSSSRADNDLRLVDTKGLVYQFDSASSATGDDNFVVTPTAGTGRWIAVGQFPNIEVQTMKGQSGTPGNPASGFYKIYVKTADGQAYIVDSAGSENPLGGGGGGGGGGLVWTGPDGASPISSLENSSSVWLFESGSVQELHCLIKIPSTYLTGKQAKMKVGLYSPSAANTILLQSTAYLIRKDTDSVASTTNSRVSTNSALTNTVANMYREAVLDLSSTIGQINAVAIAAGDMVHVKLYRGTDTDTADIRFVPSAVELTFT